MILVLGRSPGEGKGYLFQYSNLQNSMDYIVHGGHKELDMTEKLLLIAFWTLVDYEGYSISSNWVDGSGVYSNCLSEEE